MSWYVVKDLQRTSVLPGIIEAWAKIWVDVLGEGGNEGVDVSHVIGIVEGEHAALVV